MGRLCMISLPSKWSKYLRIMKTKVQLNCFAVKRRKGSAEKICDKKILKEVASKNNKKRLIKTCPTARATQL